jgi:hypothetical protein
VSFLQHLLHLLHRRAMAPSATQIPAVNVELPSKICRDKIESADEIGLVQSDVELGKLAASHLDPLYKIIEQPIGTHRPIRVACMGAGYSGLMMAMVFSEKMKDKSAELIIYERNEDLGGTWLENR